MKNTARLLEKKIRKRFEHSVSFHQFESQVLDTFFCQGANYLNSSYAQGRWVRIFQKPMTRNLAVEQIAKQYKGKWELGKKGLAAFCVQDVGQLYFAYHTLVEKLTEEAGVNFKEAQTMLLKPHNPHVWKLYNELVDLYAVS